MQTVKIDPKSVRIGLRCWGGIDDDIRFSFGKVSKEMIPHIAKVFFDFVVKDSLGTLCPPCAIIFQTKNCMEEMPCAHCESWEGTSFPCSRKENVLKRIGTVHQQFEEDRCRLNLVSLFSYQSLELGENWLNCAKDGGCSVEGAITAKTRPSQNDLNQLLGRFRKTLAEVPDLMIAQP